MSVGLKWQRGLGGIFLVAVVVVVGRAGDYFLIRSLKQGLGSLAAGLAVTAAGVAALGAAAWLLLLAFRGEPRSDDIGHRRITVIVAILAGLSAGGLEWLAARFAVAGHPGLAWTVGGVALVLIAATLAFLCYLSDDLEWNDLVSAIILIAVVVVSGASLGWLAIGFAAEGSTWLAWLLGSLAFIGLMTAVLLVAFDYFPEGIWETVLLAAAVIVPTASVIAVAVRLGLRGNVVLGAVLGGLVVAPFVILFLSIAVRSLTHISYSRSAVSSSGGPAYAPPGSAASLLARLVGLAIPLATFCWALIRSTHDAHAAELVRVLSDIAAVATAAVVLLLVQGLVIAWLRPGPPSWLVTRTAQVTWDRAAQELERDDRGQDPFLRGRLLDDPMIRERVLRDREIQEFLLLHPATRELVRDHPALRGRRLSEPQIRMRVSEDRFLQESLLRDPVIQDSLLREPLFRERLLRDMVIMERLLRDPAFRDNLLDDPMIWDRILYDRVIRERIRDTLSAYGRALSDQDLRMRLRDPEVQARLLRDPEVQERLLRDPEVRERLVRDPRIWGLSSEPSRSALGYRERLLREQAERRPVSLTGTLTRPLAPAAATQASLQIIGATGIVIDSIWSRIELVLPVPLRRDIQRRGNVVAVLRVTVASAIATAIAWPLVAGLSIRSVTANDLLLLVVAPLLVAAVALWQARRRLADAYRQRGDAVELYRFDLARAMHIPIPSDNPSLVALGRFLSGYGPAPDRLVAAPESVPQLAAPDLVSLREAIAGDVSQRLGEEIRQLLADQSEALSNLNVAELGPEDLEVLARDIAQHSYGPVSARLSDKITDLLREFDQQLHQAVRTSVEESVLGPPLANFTGYLAIELDRRDESHSSVQTTTTGTIVAPAGRRLNLMVSVVRDPRARDVASVLESGPDSPFFVVETLDVQGGHDASIVDFDAMVDSATLTPRPHRKNLRVSSEAQTSFGFDVPEQEATHEVWFQLYQAGRLVQVAGIRIEGKTDPAAVAG